MTGATAFESIARGSGSTEKVGAVAAAEEADGEEEKGRARAQPLKLAWRAARAWRHSVAIRLMAHLLSMKVSGEPSWSHA